MKKLTPEDEPKSNQEWNALKAILVFRERDNHAIRSKRNVFIGARQTEIKITGDDKGGRG